LNYKADGQFVTAGNPLASWSVCNFDNRTPDQAIRKYCCRQLSQVDADSAENFVSQLVNTLVKSGCPVTNKTPYIHKANAGFNLEGIHGGLQESAKQAFLQSKKDPQMILVIMPVS